jgi:ABC-type uncharacterized transport system involved in gliding motility auxiliary subunit
MTSRSKILFSVSLFFLICMGGMYFAMQTWMPFMWILLVFGVASIVFVGYSERKILGEFSQLKTTKHGLSMGTVLFLTLCILCFVNYFSVKFVKVFDQSITRQYTLSEQTKKIIDNLDGDLEIRYFYKEGLQNADQIKKSFLNLAKVFETYSSKIKVSSIEMNSNPSITELFGATKGTGEAFVSYKGKINRIETQFLGMSGMAYGEQDFTNAFIKTTRAKFKNIYFIEGHKERSIEDNKEELSISAFKQALEKNSYAVKSLNLISTGSIPADTDLLIIGGATEGYQKSEVALLNNYLSEGHPALILLDSAQGVVAGPSDILHNLGWKLGSEFIFNILTTPNGPMVSTDQPTVANTFSNENIITQLFGANRSALFFRPHPLEPQNKINPNIQAEVIVKTSDKSVGLAKIETTDYEGKPRSFNLGVHFKGKYQTGKIDTDVVIFSDVNLASNQFFNQTSNKDLLLNTVAYLAKETDLVSLAPKEPLATKIKMAGPEFNSYFKYILVGLFFPMPIVFLILSIAIWFKRRHA